MPTGDYVTCPRCKCAYIFGSGHACAQNDVFYTNTYQSVADYENLKRIADALEEIVKLLRAR